MSDGVAFRALRAVQIDARDLDGTLIALFKAQFDQILTSANLHWLTRYQQQCRDCISLLYFLPQIFVGRSPGQHLLGIRFNNVSLFKGSINFALSHLLPISVAILREYSQHKKFRLWADKVELACQLIDLISFVHFLAFGGSMRPSEKFVGLETVYDQRPTLGQLNFSGLNNELIGHSFANLIVLFTPLFNIAKRRISKHLMLRRMQRSSGREHSRQSPLNCAECGQIAVGLVRARRKRRKEEKWEDYCHFCLAQINSNGQMEWEALSLGSDVF